MKIHYTSDPTSLSTTRKLKSIIQGTGSKVQQVIHNLNDDLSHISTINILPLLQTQQGCFFSSNTIARYLATKSKQDLYGNANIHNKSLIDQWLDIITCDIEPATRATSKHHQGQKIQFGKLMQDVHKFVDFVQNHLGNKKYLVNDTLSIADLSLASSISVIFQLLFVQGKRNKYPNILKWYHSIVTVNKEVGVAQFSKEVTDNKKKKKGEKKGQTTNKQQTKKQQETKKQETKIQETKKQETKIQETKKQDVKPKQDDLFD